MRPEFPDELEILLLGNIRLMFALGIFLNEPGPPSTVQLGKAPGLPQSSPSLPVLPIYFSDMLSMFSPLHSPLLSYFCMCVSVVPMQLSSAVSLIESNCIAWVAF